jgi:uncharacterized protein (TIGR02246 family)
MCAYAILGVLMALTMTPAIHPLPIGLLSDCNPSLFIVQIHGASDRQNEEPELMQPEEIRTLIKKARNAWMDGDADAWAALFVPNGELIVPGNRWVGREAIRKVAADFASVHSEVKINVRRIMIVENQAVVEWHWQDKENATGRRSQADDAIVIDFKAGRIGRWREYIDAETPSRQL